LLTASGWECERRELKAIEILSFFYSSMNFHSKNVPVMMMMMATAGTDNVIYGGQTRFVNCLRLHDFLEMIGIGLRPLKDH
jgi:hypothetical protein